jgi:hypothetical protein
MAVNLKARMAASQRRVLIAIGQLALIVPLVFFGLYPHRLAVARTSIRQQVYSGNRELVGQVQVAQSTPLNLEGRYPEDIAVRVRGINFVQDRIVLNLEVINGSEVAIQLNAGVPGRGMILRDDLGNQYSLVSPESNPSIGLLSGETLAGDYTFTGPIAPAATSLTLITNDQAGQTDIVPTIVPKVIISGIPVE